MLLEAQNPLVPTPYDLVWAAVTVVILALLLTALVQVLRSPAISGAAAIGWVVILLALPVLGPVAWFVLRPRGAAALAAASRAGARPRGSRGSVAARLRPGHESEGL